MTTHELLQRLIHVRENAEVLLHRINEDIQELSDDIEIRGVENEEGDF